MFKINQEVFIISSTQIQKVVITSRQGSFYSIREVGTECRYRVRESRLYETIEEAMKDPYYRAPIKKVRNIMHPHLYELEHF